MSNTYFNISKYFHYAENENYYKEITLLKNEIKNTDKKKENTILNSKKIDEKNDNKKILSDDDKKILSDHNNKLNAIFKKKFYFYTIISFINISLLIFGIYQISSIKEYIEKYSLTNAHFIIKFLQNNRYYSIMKILLTHIDWRLLKISPYIIFGPAIIFNLNILEKYYKNNQLLYNTNNILIKNQNLLKKENKNHNG